MINVFNRKEVYSTYNMADQARVKEILESNDIECFLDNKRLESPLGGQSTISGNASPLGAQSSVSGDQNCCMEYKVFVKKTDYSLAKRLIEK